LSFPITAIVFALNFLGDMAMYRAVDVRLQQRLREWFAIW
jgi:hypothetical protein